MKDGIAVLIVGLGIGWLAGLSASPVISGVLASLLVVAGGLIVGRVENKELPVPAGSQAKVPLAILVVGIALGSTGGVVVRTHDLLGVAAPGRGDGKNVSTREGVLFQVAASECEELRNSGESQIRLRVKSSNNQRVSRLAEEFPDDGTLLKVARALCAK